MKRTMHSESPQELAAAGDHSQALRQHQVDIYVSQYCANCAYAAEIALLIQRDFPAVAVRLIDLANLQEAAPDNVFATPTYLLDGRLWSLGNPSPQQVHELLSKLE